MFNFKELKRLRLKNHALQEEKLSILADKNKAQQQINNAVEMINNFDFMKDNAYSLIRKIKNTLTY